jgi:hypothetical protein
MMPLLFPARNPLVKRVQSHNSRPLLVRTVNVCLPKLMA